MRGLGLLTCALLPHAFAALVKHIFEIDYFAVDPDGYGKAYVMGINGMFPGPTLTVRRHDRLQVQVVNRARLETVTIHWHGFEMRHAQEYDGALGITQCGIKAGENFTYDFIVDEHPGTYMYHEHAHVEHVAARGLFGVLVVLPPVSSAPLAREYDEEEVLLLSDWWMESTHALEMAKMARTSMAGTISSVGTGVGLLGFHNALINGKGGFNVFADLRDLSPNNISEGIRVSDLANIVPSAGSIWRLRLANGGQLYALRFRIDGHRLLVVQADGSDVVPYACDAVTMSSGERFDVLVTFDQTPGSYWMRAETLENQPGVHHGQLGIVRYQGTTQGILPQQGFPKIHHLESAGHLVTLNCFDQAPVVSATCRPITDLRRLQNSGDTDVGNASSTTHDFEIAARGFFGQGPSSHFTRLLDLGESPAGSRTFGVQGNQLGDNQHDGEFVQFMPPHVPYSHVGGTEQAHHPNTLAMRVDLGEVVRVVIQMQDRTSHPWHLHGHKFAVLATGFPNYGADCDVLFCRSQKNVWLTRDGLPEGASLLDPLEAPLKDTVNVPAGGWAVLQFKADNPGWWFFHCHMLAHAHDGMALVLIEGSRDVPQRLTNLTHVEGTLPSCEAEMSKWQHRGQGLSCQCWQNPDMALDNTPRSSYKCAKHYLCDDGDLLVDGGPSVAYQSGKRDRASGRLWRVAICIAWALVVASLFALKHYFLKQQKAAAVPTVDENAARLHQARFEGAMSAVRSEEEVGQKETCDMDHSKFVFRACGPLAREQFKVQQMEESSWIVGQLEDSVVAVLGEQSFTRPWLDFFAGRRQKGSIQVRGTQELNNEAAGHWHRRALRQAVGIIDGISPLRPHCTVAEVLQLVLDLMDCPKLFATQADRNAHMAFIIKVFELDRYLGVKLAALEEEAQLTVQIATELLLPRALLVIHSPLGKLHVPAVTRILRVINSLASKWHATVIFSCKSWIPPEAQECISHVMMPGEGGAPFLCSIHDLADRLTDMGQQVPEGKAAITWATEIVITGSLCTKDLTAHHMAETLTAFSVLSNDTQQWFNGLRQGWLRFLSRQQYIPTKHPASPRRLMRRPPTVALVTGFNERKRRNFFRQFWTLLSFEFASHLEESFTPYRVAETYGIAIVSGLVWFQKGSLDTQVALGECIGLLFFSTALFTVPPVFQGLAFAPTFTHRVVTECNQGLYPIPTMVLAMAVSTLVTVAIWAPIWQALAYTLADLGASPGSMLLMHGILVLNLLSLRAFSLVLYMLAPNSMLNVVIGNLLVQMFMLTNGFYTSLPWWMQWVTFFSIPRFTLRALLKLEYSWRDTFVVHPVQGMAAFGLPARYIPAELTGTFQLMKKRNMDVMESPKEMSVRSELLLLFCISITFFCLFALMLTLRTLRMDAPMDPNAEPIQVRPAEQNAENPVEEPLVLEPLDAEDGGTLFSL